MSRMLTVCGECGHEHLTQDFRPDQCEVCNSRLTGNNYSVELLDQFTEAVQTTSEKLGCSFDEAIDFVSENLSQILTKPTVSENLLNDSVIWEIQKRWYPLPL